MTAYYNEFDPKAAAWLRELIKEGHIADGVVDERSIVDVNPEELHEYTQCHFFAGIGGWSHALRLASWPDDRPVWTGSCPCQPFSDAGKGMGEADPRHLWPAWFRIIRERRPATIYGEQVASKAALRWWDGVSDDLESEGYATVAFDLCAAGIGAPTIRQRLFWVAQSNEGQRRPWGTTSGAEDRPQLESSGRSFGGRLADTDGRHSGDRELQRGGEHGQRAQDGGAGGVAISDSGERDGFSDGQGCGPMRTQTRRQQSDGQPEYGSVGSLIVPRGSGFVVPFDRMGHADITGPQGQFLDRDSADQRPAGSPGVARSFWSRFDLCLCTDGKARRIEPGSFPLVAGLPGRVGLLRGYGNAINPEVAKAFIEAYEEASVL